MTPANERKAKERKAKHNAGLVRVEVWVPAPEVTRIRNLVREIEEEIRRATGIKDAMFGESPKVTTTS